MDVTLIVKASNQQYEDLTIKCEPSWTIGRLKGHLTEVYPGKPSSDEQKLIYSGQLLTDSVVLKDVLRQYDGQQAHTVHLVFTPKNSYYGGTGGSGSSKSTRNNTGSRMSSNSSGGRSGSSSGSSSSSSGGSTSDSSTGDSREHHHDATTVDGIGSDGLRQRQTLLQTRPSLRTLPGPPAYMEQTVAFQSWMHQAYMQYLNQYINMINEEGGINALYSATGLAAAGGGTATPINPLTGSPVVPSVPFVPVTQSPGVVGSFPNIGYYPCMTGSPGGLVGGLPSASSIPTTIASATGAGGAPVLPPTATGSSFLPSPTVPGAAGGVGQGTSNSSTSLLPGATAPTFPSSSTPDTPGASASSSAAATVAGAAATGQTPGTSDTAAAAAPAPPGAVPQDGAAVEAAAPARARRFPNIVVEEQENNDWLDVFFSMCRVGILMTVIYLYSSPMRCLTVLIIGVMLYLKKHLDRVYQAIDRRLTRLPAAQEGNAGQPQPANANNVPDQPAAASAAPQAQQRPGGEDHRAETPASAGDEQQPSASPRTERAAEPERPEAAGPSSPPSGPVPRPRTGPASSRVAQANPADAAAEPPLLERPATAGSEPTPAEQPAAEGQRMTFNDMTSFLGTLVITFFTSIIPDTPAA